MGRTQGRLFSVKMRFGGRPGLHFASHFGAFALVFGPVCAKNDPFSLGKNNQAVDQGRSDDGSAYTRYKKVVSNPGSVNTRLLPAGSRDVPRYDLSKSYQLISGYLKWYKK